jgi:hypothetical protein
MWFRGRGVLLRANLDGMIDGDTWTFRPFSAMHAE